MSKDIAWPAPAKLNLMLHIVGRREDGYHLLQTVFQFLDYGDRLFFDVNQSGAVSRKTGNEDVSEEHDLIIKAAKVLQSYAATGVGVEIKVEKNLPMGGGLGGGSSDAATTLLVLNRLWDINMPVDDLAKLGLSLGADVPVFVRGFAAWAEGVGEDLKSVELHEPWYVVLKPDCEVSTARIFSDPDLTRTSELTTIAAFLSGGGRNDCVPVVRKHYPQVAQAMDWLDQFSTAKLTGTGACVFASFDNEQSAKEVIDKLPDNLGGFVAKGLNRSPLLDMLEKI